ncbi:MAG: hypothetical protein JNL74_20945, partial [Fibrobacteres bacterium]|nr:hypothetical protein [Fibrobacterota bacterium]
MIKTNHFLPINTKYSTFLDKYREIAHLEQIGALMGWDQETYMPQGAVVNRADQSATLSAIHHRYKTDTA